MLDRADVIYVLDHGSIVASGTLTEIQNAGFQLDNLLADESSESEDGHESNEIKDSSVSSPALLSPGLSRRDEHDDVPHHSSPLAREKESAKDKKAKKTPSKQNSPAMGTADSQEDQQNRQQKQQQGGSDKAKQQDTQAEAQQLMTKEDREIGLVRFSVWMRYLRAAGIWMLFAFVIPTYIVYRFISIAQNWWLSYWSTNNEHEENINGPGGPHLHSTMFYIWVYLGLGFGSVLVLMIQTLLVARAGTRASRRLHQEAIDGVMFAPTSYFDTTPLGRILNRFSGDVETIDDSLRDNMASFVSQVFSLISVVFVLGFLSPYILLIFIS